MSDEKFTPSAQEAMKEAVLVEVLGDVGEIKELVKAIKPVLLETSKQVTEERRLALDALRATGTAEKEKLASEAAKLVRDGVFSETNELKREVRNLIAELKRATEKIRSEKRWDFIFYVIVSSSVIVLAIFFIDKVILKH
jgi:hypothetical protein